MVAYADPELLISEWLHEQTGRKAWCDPELPHNYSFTAPIYHVQRGQGEGDNVLTLDSAIIDLDTLAQNADHARSAAQEAWSLMRLTLPLHVFDGGIFITGVQTLSAPCWTPATGVYRRSAAYRVFLHGLI
jgi:hypothetical protein